MSILSESSFSSRLVEIGGSRLCGMELNPSSLKVEYLSSRHLAFENLSPDGLRKSPNDQHLNNLRIQNVLGSLLTIGLSRASIKFPAVLLCPRST
jgi:hypothetical protein